MSILSSILGGGGSNTASQQKQIAGLAKRQRELGDELIGSLRTADRTGVWDPNAALERLRADTTYQTGVNAGNQVAAARTLGYRPGDSEPLLRMNAMGQKANLDYADQAAGLRERSILGRLNAYNGTLGNVGSLYGQSANLYGNAAGLAAQDAQSRQAGSGIGSILGAVAPFLMPGGGAAPRQASVAPQSLPYSTGFSLPYSTQDLMKPTLAGAGDHSLKPIWMN